MNIGIGVFGSHIVEQLLNSIKSANIDTISLIASSFGEPVYRKFGFETVCDYIYLERKKPWIKRAISDKIVSYNSKFYHDIIKLDNEISGEEREPLLNLFIKSSFVYIEQDKVCGFYIPTLGEGQTFATTTEAGLALMNMKYKTVDTAVIPATNQTGLTFLKNNGFGESEATGKRMIIGQEIDWQPTKIFSRISGDYG